MNRGFTLIEMLVSVAIFAVVMVIALGALLAMSSADRRAEALKTAINNLNFAVDSMSRDVRTGFDLGCSASTIPTPGTSCANGGNVISYTSAQFGGTVLYKYDTSASDCGQTGTAVGCIARSLNGGTTWSPVTSPDIIIGGLSQCGTIGEPCLFYLIGATQGDGIQPKLSITLNATVAVSATQTSSLTLQTSVTQRLYDQ